MIRLLTARLWIRLVAAAMVVTVPMITFAQTTEPAIESMTAVPEATVVDASPRGDDENSTKNDQSAQIGPPARSTIPTSDEVEIQSHFNELRRELLDDRADTIDWWLTGITIFLGVITIIAVGGGYITVRRVQEVNKEVEKKAEAAKRLLDEIERNRDKSHDILLNLNAETAANNPGEANRAIANISENPKASVIDRAIAHALSLQRQGKINDAIEKWRALAHIAEETDNDLAARAWYSIGYLVLDESPEDCILAYDRVISLQPDLYTAYNNRGNAKSMLGQYEAAIADYDETIHLKPDLAEAYNNRGNTKADLKQYEAAIADYDETIRLKPDLAEAYNNRGSVKADLKQYEAAIADCDEAIRLKPDYGNAYNSRGSAKYMLGQHEAAIADYDETIRLKPDLAEAYYNRGEAKVALDLKDEARKDLETALDLAPNGNNADLVAKVEQLLLELDNDGST